MTNPFEKPAEQAPAQQPQAAPNPFGAAVPAQPAAPQAYAPQQQPSPYGGGYAPQQPPVR